MDVTLMMVFWGAMAMNLVTLVLFLSVRKTAWLFLVPWIGLALGLAWFTHSRSYFAQPEVLLDVPIRIDLVLLPPLMVFALFAGIVRIIMAGKNIAGEGKT